MVWVVSRFRLKAPPGISYSYISPLTSSGQRSRASWASQPQKSASLSPQPGGKPRKFIRTCGGIGKKKYIYISIARTVFVFGATAPQSVIASSFTRFLDHTRRRTTIGRTPLYEWSARRRDLSLQTHTTLTTDKRPSDQLVAETSPCKQTQHSQQTNVHAPSGIRTHNLSRRSAAYLRPDRAATGTGHWDGIWY